MKTLYLECAMGASGDMLMAALLDLMPDAGRAVEKLNALGVPGARVTHKRVSKMGIEGSGVSVSIGGQVEKQGVAAASDHGGRTPADIGSIIERLNASDFVKENTAAVYKLLADAEAKVHGVPVLEVHFHELGAMDAVMDIAGFCLLIEELAPDRIMASEVVTGYGHIKNSHGELPVPAPATAELLNGIPSRRGKIEAELCTPTGAALLRHFVDEFTDDARIAAQRLGYGMGSKDFALLNCVRAFIGEAGGAHSVIAELCCNLDDMPPEAVSFAMERLFVEGALDAFTTPIMMKKNRQATLLTCLCAENEAGRMAALILKHTSTAGVRVGMCKRYVMSSSLSSVSTAYGEVKIKRYQGYGADKIKPEFEDVAAAARKHGVSFGEVSGAAVAAWNKGGEDG